MIGWIMGVLILAVYFSCFILWRNHRVYKFRMALLELVGMLCDADVAAGREWRWRYDELGVVSYDDMMWRFWVRLRPELWWDDLSFLRPGKND